MQRGREREREKERESLGCWHVPSSPCVQPCADSRNDLLPGIVKIFRVRRSKPHRHCFPWQRYTSSLLRQPLWLASCIISRERISTVISLNYRTKKTNRPCKVARGNIQFSTFKLSDGIFKNRWDSWRKNVNSTTSLILVMHIEYAAYAPKEKLQFI